MYKAKWKFIQPGLGVVAKGAPLKKNPVTDRLFEMGYLNKSEVKKNGKGKNSGV